jgi:hypothetical protein
MGRELKYNNEKLNSPMNRSFRQHFDETEAPRVGCLSKVTFALRLGIVFSAQLPNPRPGTGADLRDDLAFCSAM